MWSTTILLLVAVGIHCSHSLQVSEKPVKVCKPDATLGYSPSIATEPSLMKQTYSLSEAINAPLLRRAFNYTADAEVTTAEMNNKIVFECQSESNPVDGILDILTPHLSKTAEFVQKFAKSCKELHDNNPSAPSGFYKILLNNGSLLEVYCDMVGADCENLEGWTRLGYFDMTNDNYNTCPDLLQSKTYTGISNPVCQRVSNQPGCDSLYFDNFGMQYDSVCGRALAYQFGSPDGIQSWYGIDSNYVDGLSITHGTPRKHIWTYINGYREDLLWGNSCPCNTGSTKYVPSFVGNNYHCESALSNVHWSSTIYPDDKLWDGKQCDYYESGCCNNNAPWFSKLLTESTTDQIEVRVCDDEIAQNERTPLEMLEIYVR